MTHHKHVSGEWAQKQKTWMEREEEKRAQSASQDAHEMREPRKKHGDKLETATEHGTKDGGSEER